MARNKYGYPVPEPIKTAHHKHHFKDGGIMGFFSKDETPAEKSARYIREADARIKAREALDGGAPSKEALDGGAPSKIAPAPVDNSPFGLVKGRKKQIDDAIDAAETGATQAKRKGGIVKPRGVGVAQRGHGKGRMR